MQDKHFLFQSLYIFVHDIHIMYNDCNISEDYQCSAENKKENKRDI